MRAIVWPLMALFPALYSQASFAQSELDRLKKKVAPIVAPTTTVIIDVVKGKDPVKSVTDTAADQTRVIVSTANTVTAIDQALEDKIKSAVGGDLAKAIEIVRLPQKLQTAVAIQTIATAGESFEKQRVDLKTVATIPFAAALEQAIALYKPRSQPMPLGMKMLLAATFEKAALEDVRFVIDDNLGSLPGAINFLKERSDDNHAVTVGNIIVFARDPGLNNVHFWAHETQHTVQYAKLGVSGFAAKYSTDFAALEKEAEEMAVKADRDAEVIIRFIKAQADLQK